MFRLGQRVTAFRAPFYSVIQQRSVAALRPDLLGFDWIVQKHAENKIPGTDHQLEQMYARAL